MDKSTFRVLASGVLAGSLFLVGCGFSESKKEAEGVVSRHFQAIAAGDFEAALADYGEPFYQRIARDDWSKVLANLTEKLGAYQSHSVTTWRARKNAGTSGSGTTVSLQCEVTYSKHPATETFTLFKGAGDSDFAIVGHNINAMALLAE
jgi:hypothetical protein